MKIGILAAMDTEAQRIIDSLTNHKTETIAGFTYYSGLYKDVEIVITICSIGKVNSAVSTQIMIDHFSPDFIINSGIAGGLDDRLSVLSIVIGESLTYHDFDHEIMEDFFPNVTYFHSDKKAVELAMEVGKDLGFDIFSGTIVTGDQFIEDNEIKESLKERFHPMCVEMEGAAISHVAYINNIPSLVIRCISDMADTGGKMTYLEFKEKASQESASLVLELVERL